MRNLYTYDQFIVEKINFKKIKNKVELEFNYLKASTFLKIFKYLFFWRPYKKSNLHEAQLLLNRMKKFSKFVIKTDIEEKLKKSSEEECREYLKILEDKYQKMYKASLIEDFKGLLNINPKKSKYENKEEYKKFMKIIFDKNDKEDIDPYGEEEWEDESENSFGLFDIARNQGYAIDQLDFLQHIKNLVLGKMIMFIPEKEINIGGYTFKTKIRVKDVKFVNQYMYDGVIFIDEDGEEHIPSTFKQDKIKILPE
jgi:hypothetical protein